jgi:tetratricopeptide (TPR) repeat protein
MKGRFLLIPGLLLAGVLAWAQVTSDFTITASPGVAVPLGPSLSDGLPFYTVGGGVSLKGEYTLPFAQAIYTGLMFDADILPINGAGSQLTLLSLGPEVGLQFFPVPRLGIRLAGFGGMYAGFVFEDMVLNPFAGGLADISYMLSPALSMGLGASYKYAFTPSAYVYQGLGITVGVRYHVGAGKGTGTLRVEPQIAPIFPLFYSYYDKNPAGTLVVRNTSPGAVQDLSVSFQVKQFMDQPKVCWTAPQLARGEEVTVPVYALFRDSIFQVTEATKVAGEIQVTYKYLGAERTTSQPVTVSIYNRNAMSWDDTAKAAAFVTPNDSVIRAVSARAVPDARAKGRPAVTAGFRSAVALFNALGVVGAAYLPDPTVDFTARFANKAAVDFLQFAPQTLDIRAGDCDDLSILYATLLESAGIETAFVTVPGHIYVAFKLDMDRKSAEATFGDTKDFIIMDGEPWVPVEVTLVKNGFLKAWQVGAQEWRAGVANGSQGFTPVHKAWGSYPPANTGDALRIAVTPPDAAAVYKSYSAEIAKVLDAYLQPRVAQLQKDLAKSQGDQRLLTRLGVLYARFGMYDEAKQQFTAILKKSGEVVSALVNLGNISYLTGKYKEALDFFTRALAKSPGSSAALQGITLAGYEVGDTAAVRNALSALKSADPEAAERLSGLGPEAGDGSGRAGAGTSREISTWTEE